MYTIFKWHFSVNSQPHLLWRWMLQKFSSAHLNQLYCILFLPRHNSCRPLRGFSSLTEQIPGSLSYPLLAILSAETPELCLSVEAREPSHERCVSYFCFLSVDARGRADRTTQQFSRSATAREKCCLPWDRCHCWRPTEDATCCAETPHMGTLTRC